MPAVLADLKEALAQRFPDAMPIAYRMALPVRTGIARLDALLPGGGLPRGRVTVWTPGGGATAVLRATCHAVVEQGERTVWVDAAGMVAADTWRAGPLLLRPAGELEALTSAEELLRSGGFALVVLAGCGRLERTGIRLGRAARAGGAAFVALGGDAPVAHLRLHSRIDPADYRWIRSAFGEPAEVVAVTVRVEARSLGWSGATDFRLPVLSHAQRIAPAPWLSDRRGAKRKSLPMPAAPAEQGRAAAPRTKDRMRPEVRAWAAAKALGRR
jgi:hypothetical protein